MKLHTKQELIQLCQQLSSKGIQPSVGLLRSKTTAPASMQDIIKILQQWKRDPDSLLQQVEHPAPAMTGSSTTETLEKRIEQLEKQVALLMKRAEKSQG